MPDPSSAAPADDRAADAPFPAFVAVPASGVPWTVRLAAVALLAAMAAPAGQAGPFEDALQPVWGVTDPTVECLDPRTGDCSRPCDTDDCADDLDNALGDLQDRAEGPAEQAYQDATARAESAIAGACGLTGCDPTAAGLAEAAAGVVAAASPAPGAAWNATNGTAAAGTGALADALGQGFGATDGAVAAARRIPRAVDDALPSSVYVTCDDVLTRHLGPTCGVWMDRYPLPVADAGLLYCPPPPGSTDELRILYCGAVHGVPKSLDQFYENLTQGPLTPGEVISQALLLTERVQGCMAGRYPPCPRMAVGLE
jgi:hypothetical protein